GIPLARTRAAVALGPSGRESSLAAGEAPDPPSPPRVGAVDVNLRRGLSLPAYPPSPRGPFSRLCPLPFPRPPPMLPPPPPPRRPLTHAVEGQDRRLVERRGEERTCRWDSWRSVHT